MTSASEQLFCRVSAPISASQASSTGSRQLSEGVTLKFSCVPWHPPPLQAGRRQSAQMAKRSAPKSLMARTLARLRDSTYRVPGVWTTVGTRIKGDPNCEAYSTQRKAPALPWPTHLRLVEAVEA